MSFSRGTLGSRELDITTNGMNSYFDLPKQVFCLTYLEDNQTQNPDSLGPLEELRKKTWQTYLIGILSNFTYLKSQINSFIRVLNTALNPDALNDHKLKYVSEVVITEELSPTDNDSDAIVITVSEVCEEMEQNKQVFKGYLMSWCNPIKASGTLLPLLLCNGRKMIRNVVLEVIQKRFDVFPKPLMLMQEDFRRLSTYCLIMLGENDSGQAMLHYKIPPGIIKLVVPLPDMLKLWSHVHQEDTDEVELDEVLLFHNALEQFFETTFGIKLHCAQVQQMKVDGFFNLRSNSEIWSNSTRIIHVCLKYLNYVAVQRLKVKTLERINQAAEVSMS